MKQIAVVNNVHQVPPASTLVAFDTVLNWMIYTLAEDGTQVVWLVPNEGQPVAPEPCLSG